MRVVHCGRLPIPWGKSHGADHLMDQRGVVIHPQKRP
jgi:hypothetical protein